MYHVCVGYHEDKRDKIATRLPVINWCRVRQGSVQVFVEARGRKFVREMTPTVIQIDLRGLVYPGFIRKL
jgi:hypothetical protein